MDDQYAINLAKTEFREGYNVGDAERVLAVFADSFTDMSEGQSSFWNVDAKTMRRMRLEKLFREHDVELTPVIIDIAVSGDIAVEHGWHHLKRRLKAGGPIEVRSTRYVEVWKRNANRVWQIVLFLDNADQTPELTQQTQPASDGRQFEES